MMFDWWCVICFWLCLVLIVSGVCCMMFESRGTIIDSARSRMGDRSVRFRFGYFV